MFALFGYAIRDVIRNWEEDSDELISPRNVLMNLNEVVFKDKELICLKDAISVQNTPA